MQGPHVGSEQRPEDVTPDNVRQLKRQFERLQRSHLEMAGHLNWISSVATILTTGPHGWWQRWLPYWWWDKLLMRRLQRQGLFDAAEYLRQNQDVKNDRIHPLVHLLRYGLTESRSGVPQISALPPAPQKDLSPQIAAIRDSGLFDHDWYLAQNPDASSIYDDAVVEYLERSSLDPLHQAGPLFSGAHYLLENGDTRSMHPLLHFVQFGMREGRRAFSPANADAFIEAAHEQPLATLTSLLDSTKPTLVLYWQDGNFFFTDIAIYVKDYLARRGYACQCLTNDSALLSGDHNLVVVAPHEYCIHGPGKNWPHERLARAVYVNTEQWHTSWFSLALGVMRTSRKAVDINPASARGLRRLGIDAGFLPLLPLESPVFTFERASLSEQTVARRYIKPLTWPQDFSDRPYDVLFVGALNARREEALAGMAPALAKHDCFIHCPRMQGPVNARSGNMVPSRDVAQLARNARILLNIHQGESRYFEWHRLFVSGIWEGCIVLTEPCTATGLVEPGVHYLEHELDGMGDYIDWLLLTDDGRALLETVRANCARLLARLHAGEEFLP